MKPNVLLFGNGLYRCYSEDSWNDFLKNMLRRDDLPDNLEQDLRSPMMLKARLITDGNIKEGLNSTKKSFYGNLNNDELREKLRAILSIGFDDIITTNYDYRIETAATEKESVSRNFLNRNAHNLIGDRVETKYLIHSFQSVDYNGINNRIWHIHGEAKKKDSMILSLYYYCNLLSRIMEFSRKSGNKYLEAEKAGTDLQTVSWIDSFIRGDIYVIGFGFDYSEIDLWWLLERKFNEKANHGKVYYYEPLKPEDEKYKLLRTFDVEIINFNMFCDGKDDFFSRFYDKAIEDIESKMEGNTK